jgi:hypothetical protein
MKDDEILGLDEDIRELSVRYCLDYHCLDIRINCKRKA